MSADREGQPEDETGGEGVDRGEQDGVDEGEEVERSAYEDDEEDVEPYSADGGVTPAPESGRLGRQSGRRSVRSEQGPWRRFAWVALIILTAGVAWALILSTILINRSGDRTAELISLFEAGQQQRGGAVGQIPQNQAARRAALEAQLQQTRTLRAEAGAAKAKQAADQAAARQAIASAGLAGARSRQADAEAGLAETLTNRASIEPPSRERPALTPPSLTLDPSLTFDPSVNVERPSLDLERKQLELLKKLQTAIQELRQAIEDLRPRP